MQQRSSRWLVCFFILAMLTSSCARLRIFRPSRNVQPQAVGVVLPLSGPYQLVGEAFRDGIQQALKGSDVELLIRDSKGDPSIAALAVEELALKEGVISILGGVSRDEAAAAAERADALGVVFLSFSKADDATSAGSFVFRNMPTLKSQAKAIAQFSACELGHKSYAVLAPDAEFARELTTDFTEAIEEAGGSIKKVLTYPPEQTTFTAEARALTGRSEPEKRPEYLEAQRKILKEETDPTRRRKALEKARSSLPPIIDFDALFLPEGWKTVSLIAPALAVEDLVTNACDPQDMERIRKTMGRSKLQTVTLLGWSGWSSPTSRDGVPELLTRGGKYLHCGIYVDGFFDGSSRSSTRAFVNAWKKDHNGAYPNLLHALGYDSANIHRRLIERSAPKDSDELQDLLENLEGFDGVTGTTSFDADRNASKPPFFLRVEPSGLRELTPKNGCAPATARR